MTEMTAGEAFIITTCLAGPEEQRMTGEIERHPPKGLQGAARAVWFLDLDGWGQASLALRCRTCPDNLWDPGQSAALRTHSAPDLTQATTVLCTAPCLLPLWKDVR